MFAYVLDYLRGSTIPVSLLTHAEIARLLHDADYYQLDGLCRLLVPSRWAIFGPGSLNLACNRFSNEANNDNSCAVLIDNVGPLSPDQIRSDALFSFSIEVREGVAFTLGFAENKSAIEFLGSQVAAGKLNCDDPLLMSAYAFVFDPGHKKVRNGNVTADYNGRYTVGKYTVRVKSSRIYVAIDGTDVSDANSPIWSIPVDSLNEPLSFFISNVAKGKTVEIL
jgi:hypothetical protein